MLTTPPALPTVPEPFTLDQQVRMLLHAPDAFEHWLIEDCNLFVGHTGMPRECPIAHFLRSKLQPWLTPAVYADSVAIFGPSPTGVEAAVDQIPTWVHSFVLLIDNRPVVEGRMLLEPVRRDQALEALRTIVQVQEALGRAV